MQKTHGSFGDHAAVPLQHAAPHTAYSYPPTPQDWTNVQDAIYYYYVTRNQPLHVVRDLLKESYGFKATERMIKARLSKWEFSKNAKREDWGCLAVLYDRRKRSRKATVFEIRGHRKTVKDLQRFIRNQNISYEDFLAESKKRLSEGQPIPRHVRAFTPQEGDGNQHLPSPRTLTSDTRSPSPLAGESQQIGSGLQTEPAAKLHRDNNEFLHYYDPAKSERDNFQHECPYETLATKSRPVFDDSTAYPSMTSRTSSSHDIQLCERTRHELEFCSMQLLQPSLLKSRIGNNDMRCWSIITRTASAHAPEDVMDLTEHNVCSRCEQPESHHFPSLDLFEPEHKQRNILNDAAVGTLHLPTSTRDEGAWVWVSFCFLACMSFRRGDDHVAEQALVRAQFKFEMLLRAQDPLLLTAAGLMITILHMHDQERIVVRILESARVVVERILPKEDPIRITIQYLAMSADTSGKLLTWARFSSKHLKPVYDQLKARYTIDHPYTIAAHYNYAWMLKYENKNEAEEHARAAYKESANTFGEMHMQTITALSVVAGCLALQPNKNAECVDTYRNMIHNASEILGIIHPYTLEAQRRLANMLQDQPGQAHMALKLHRTVLFGRATMLGRDHMYTTGQRCDYQHMLQKLGRWFDANGDPSIEQREVLELFSKDPDEPWELVSRVDDDIWARSTSDPDRGQPGNARDEEWCRVAFAESISRSQSPLTSCHPSPQAYLNRTQVSTSL